MRFAEAPVVVHNLLLLLGMSRCWPHITRAFYFGTVIGLVISKENGKEELVMELTILIIIAALGLMIPVFWLVGTATGITYFCLHGVRKTRREQTVPLNSELGLTMADGGDPVDKKEKE